MCSMVKARAIPDKDAPAVLMASPKKGHWKLRVPLPFHCVTPIRDRRAGRVTSLRAGSAPGCGYLRQGSGRVAMLCGWNVLLLRLVGAWSHLGSHVGQ